MQALSSDGAVGETAVSAATRARAAFDLKGVTASLTVMRLRSRDLNLIERQLRAKVTQFPQFFVGAPVLLDVGGLEGGLKDFPLAALVRAMRFCKVVPVAAVNVAEAERELAVAAGLGLLNQARPQDGKDGKDGVAPAEAAAEESAAPPKRPPPPPRQAPAAEDTVETRPPAREPSPAAAPAAHRPPVVVRQPVRSGQIIYAEKTDLIVLAPVNPGAQLIADGNIHIYAPLRGRALAGAQGYADARIFCQKIEAELIAIAGAYVTFDDIPKDRLGKSVQVSFADGKCVISPL